MEPITLSGPLPLIALKESVLFPGLKMPIFVQRSFSVAAVHQAIAKDRLVMVVAQKDAETKDIQPEALYTVGTVARIQRMVKQLDGRLKLIVEGRQKAVIQNITQEKDFFSAEVMLKETLPYRSNDLQVEALVGSVRSGLEQLHQLNNRLVTSDVIAFSHQIIHPGQLAELVINNISRSVELSQIVLEKDDIKAKLEIVSEFIQRELNLSEIKNDIKNKAKEKLGKAQKEYFLKEQMKQIQQELGQSDPHAAEIDEYEQRIKEKELPEEAKKEAEKQLSRLRSMNPAASETGVLKTWIDTLLELPWNESTKDNKNIKKARAILEKDHYGLEEIKERILEFLAVRQVKGNSKSPILCFIGPPGVGKTSLGRSIARALGRKFYRMSLGGLHDEAEIRGHRRTYVGAMPGKILESMKITGTVNPVIMLDEIDKVGKDFRGDPSSALLEVLDPEQNFSFRDNYIGVPYDLSKVFFIATANWEDTIPAPLKDRMEVINLSGYTDLERLQIAKRYLIPRQQDNNGLDKGELTFTNDALMFLLRRYTREAGVRNLERVIGNICRKVVVRKLSNVKTPKRITKKVVEEFLKLPPYSDALLDLQPRIGTATGLAWTMFGGTILRIETNMMKGKGGIILTGKLGEVMKESARIAISYTLANCEKFGLPADFSLNQKDIHIHFPAGATPKDGPSAGITITTALISLFTGRTVDRKIGMTGEISLTGEVLPIGGLREKMLAAKRNGLEAILVPAKNEPLYESISEEIKTGLEVMFVSDYEEVYEKMFGSI
ncbi:endopeptidase La [bacterium]|nr:endopeptidase La [bacterium]